MQAVRQRETTPFLKEGWVSGKDAQTATTGIVTVLDGAGQMFCAVLF